MSENLAGAEDYAAIRVAVVRLRARVMALATSFLCGTGLALATLWLVVRGGPNVGKHLGLLRHYFPGYTVSVPGVFVGFAYAAVVGAVIGWSVAQVYNRVVRYRHED